MPTLAFIAGAAPLRLGRSASARIWRDAGLEPRGAIRATVSRPAPREGLWPLVLPKRSAGAGGGSAAGVCARSSIAIARRRPQRSITRPRASQLRADEDRTVPIYNKWPPKRTRNLRKGYLAVRAQPRVRGIRRIGLPPWHAPRRAWSAHSGAFIMNRCNCINASRETLAGRRMVSHAARLFRANLRPQIKGAGPGGSPARQGAGLVPHAERIGASATETSCRGAW